MAFYHGVKTTEVKTSLVSPIEAESAITLAVGTAPIHLAAEPTDANKPVLCYTYDEYVKNFGYDGNFEDFTLDEVAQSQFALFGVAPTIFVNVLDAEKHSTAKEIELEGVENTPAKIQDNAVISSLEVESVSTDTTITSLTENQQWQATIQIGQNTPADDYYTIDIYVGAKLPSDDLQVTYDIGTDTAVVPITANNLPYDLPIGAHNISLAAKVPKTNQLEKNKDYTAAYNSDRELVITILDAAKIFNDTIKVKYKSVNPSAVTAEDIIGGIDIVTLKNKGLECIEDCFSKFRLVPSIIISPKYSCDPTVAAVMKAKCTNINSVFNAIALVDIPTDEVTNYTAAAEYKNKKNLVDSSVVACWPKVSLSGKQYHISTQLASLMAYVDAQNGAIPFTSPSNHNLQTDSTILLSGEEVELTLDKANYLNSKGITTALNFANGWVLWGNRTSIYDSSSDPREIFIPVRRIFYWLRNTIVLTYFQYVDRPLNRRLLESVTDSINIYLNGLTARGALLGGRVELLRSENPTTDLMSGLVRFHLRIAPATPAENLQFILEYDPSYLETLFE